VRAVSTTAGAAIATTVGVTALAGTGYGWIGALKTPVSPQNWALTSLLGRATAAALTKIGSDFWESIIHEADEESKKRRILELVSS
jgi:alpha-1,6-mannosyltransferase